METQVRDLWPADIGVATLITPVSILREQAALLGEKTSNLVQAEVKTTSEGARVMHSFYLVAPAMNKYRYRLLYVTHDVALYPLNIVFDPANSQVTAKSQDAFVEQLGKLLSSEKTITIVQSLVAQSQQ